MDPLIKSIIEVNLDDIIIGKHYKIIQEYERTHGLRIDRAEDIKTHQMYVVKCVQTLGEASQVLHELDVLRTHLSACPGVPQVVESGWDEENDCMFTVLSPVGSAVFDTLRVSKTLKSLSQESDFKP